jgi:hypothetical protein
MSRRQDRKREQAAQLQAERQAELEITRLYHEYLRLISQGIDDGLEAVVRKLMELTGKDAMQVGSEAARRH